MRVLKSQEKKLKLTLFYWFGQEAGCMKTCLHKPIKILIFRIVGNKSPAS